MRLPKFVTSTAPRLAAGAVFAAGVFAAATIRAAEPDAAGAADLKKVFETYVGAPAPGAPSAVEVTPVGSAYEVAIDLDRLAAPLRAVGLEPAFGRDVLRLTPKPDGTWSVAFDRLDPIAWKAAGQTGRVTFEDVASEGVFDPALAAFTSQSVHIGRIVSEQTVPAAADTPRVDVRKTDETIDVVGTAKPSASGEGVDVAVTQTSGATVETFSVTEGRDHGIPDLDATLKVAKSRLYVAATDLRSRALLDLWAHLVAHHATEDLDAGRAALKDKIAGLGPFFDHLHQTARLDGIELETPVGFGSLAGLGIEFDVTGATRDGTADLRFDLAGLEMHSLFIPKWAAPLLPTDLTLRTRAAGWDAAAAFAAWLDVVDFARPGPLPDETRNRLLALLLPRGTVEFDLTGNRVHGPLWDLSCDGRVVTGPAGASGALTVRASGVDAVSKALAAPEVPSEFAGAGASIEMAVAFAERGDDGSLVWRFTFEGSDVRVNGRPLEETAPTPVPTPEPQAAPEPAPKTGKHHEPVDKKI